MREDGDRGCVGKGMGGAGDATAAQKRGRKVGSGEESRQLAYSRQRSGRLYFYIKYPRQRVLPSLALPRSYTVLLSRHRRKQRVSAVTRTSPPKHPRLLQRVRPVHSGIYIKRLRDDDN